MTEEGETPLRPECAVLVLPDEVHHFRSGDEAALRPERGNDDAVEIGWMLGLAMRGLREMVSSWAVGRR